MSETDLRIDPLTGACVVVTPWRQHRPNQPDGLCPFCPGGLEAPGPYDVLHIPNRWPALPGGCHEVVLHSSDRGMGGMSRKAMIWLCGCSIVVPIARPRFSNTNT
jgi:UDPglucose--hexose-1-phosphate uridylyltransferase